MKSLRSENRKPAHPGAILREDILPALKMSQAKIAKALKVSHYVISQIIRECKPVTPDIAIRLARFLGGTPDSWLNMQQKLDFWLLEKKNRKVYENIKAVDKAA